MVLCRLGELQFAEARKVVVFHSRILSSMACILMTGVSSSAIGFEAVSSNPVWIECNLQGSGIGYRGTQIFYLSTGNRILTMYDKEKQITRSLPGCLNEKPTFEKDKIKLSCEINHQTQKTVFYTSIDRFNLNIEMDITKYNSDGRVLDILGSYSGRCNRIAARPLDTRKPQL